MIDVPLKLDSHRCDQPGLQVVDPALDHELLVSQHSRDDRRGFGKDECLVSDILPYGRVQVSPGHLDGWPDVLKEPADLPGKFRPLHRGRDGTAGRVPQDVYGFNSDDRDCEFQASNIFIGCNVARDPRDEQVSESLIEDDFDGNT